MPCQQDDVYAAERGLNDGECFSSLGTTQQFVDLLRDTWWWIKWLETGDLERIEVGPARRGAKFAGVGSYDREKACGRVEFSTSTPSLRLVVHEITHVIASCRKNSKSHDPWFARIYLELTYLIMGPSAFQELMLEFIAHGVDFDAEGITEWHRSAR